MCPRTMGWVGSGVQKNYEIVFGAFEPDGSSTDTIGTGRASLNSTRTNVPQWRLEGLQQHYQKHCIDERPCLDEVLHIPSSITRDQYEDVARQSYEDAYIRYDAVETNRQHGGSYPKRHYRIDGRSMKTITDLDVSSPRYFRSCFHVHYGRGHRTADLRKLPGDQVLAYLEKLLADKEQGKVSECRVQCTNALNGLPGKTANFIRAEVQRLNKLM